MVGREAYHNPYLLAQVDQDFYDDNHPIPTALEVASMYIDYCRDEVHKGTRLNHVSRHILGLFQGVRGAKQFRRHISENAHKPDATVTVLEDALAYVN